MEAAELEKDIKSFIAQVFNRLDTTVDLSDRPLSSSDQWNRHDIPIVQMIFPEDIVTVRPIDANYVATYPITDLFSRDQFVEACVYTIQGIPEHEIAEPILRYVDALVETYRKSAPSTEETPPGDQNLQTNGEGGGKPDGWK